MVDSDFFTEFNKFLVIEQNRILLDYKNCDYTLELYISILGQIVFEWTVQENPQSDIEQFYQGTVALTKIESADKGCVWSRGDGSQQLPGSRDQSLGHRPDLSSQNLSNSKSRVLLPRPQLSQTGSDLHWRP